MAQINLQKIIAVKGQPGLFHLTNYNPKGYFLQPFEGGPVRFFSNEKGKVLALGNVDLKLSDDQSINLLEVFRLMDKHQVPVIDTSKQELISFFNELIPNLDSTVATSHLQKTVSWYYKIRELFQEKEIVNEEVDGLTIV